VLARCEVMKLTAAHRAQQYEYFTIQVPPRLIEPEAKEQIARLVKEMQASPEAYVRRNAYRVMYEMALVQGMGRERMGVLMLMLNDRDPIVRNQGIDRVARLVSRWPGSTVKTMLPHLDRMAKEDSDPLNRAAAQELARVMRSVLAYRAKLKPRERLRPTR